MSATVIVIVVFGGLYVAHTANSWLMGKIGERLSNRIAERDRRHQGR